MLEGSVEVEVPAGTQPHETLIVRGAGMPALRGRRTGDLRVVVNVVTPRHLNHKQRKLFEELAESLTHHNLRTEEGVFGKLRRAFHGHGAPLGALTCSGWPSGSGGRTPRSSWPSCSRWRRRGVEEVDLGDGVVEYAVYGAPGELPALPEVTRGGRSGPGRGAHAPRCPTTGTGGGASFTSRSCSVAGCRCVRPGRVAGAAADRPGDRSGTGVRDRCPRHHAAVPGADAGAMSCRSRAGRSSTSAAARGCWPSRRRRLGWSPVVAVDFDPLAVEAAAANAARERGARSRCAGMTCGSIRWWWRRRWRRTCCGRCCCSGRIVCRRRCVLCPRASDRQRATGR